MIPLTAIQRHAYHRTPSNISSLTVDTSFTAEAPPPPSITDKQVHEEINAVQGASTDRTRAISQDEMLLLPKSFSPPSRRPWNHSLSDWWTLEIASLLFGAACFAAVLGICARTQNRPLTQWNSSIAPNAMVSTLTTLSKAGVLLAVAECISQLKWSYFGQHPRSLEHLDRFDSASRSPLGASRFILSFSKSSPIATFASLVIVIALAFEPMAQQVFSFNNRLVLNRTGVAEVPRAQVYDMASVGEALTFSVTMKDNTPALAMQTAILNSVYGAGTGEISSSLQLPITCPSIACSWPSFTTLGVCGQCSNVTTQTIVKCSDASLAPNLYVYAVCSYTTPGNYVSTGMVYLGGDEASQTSLNVTTRSIEASESSQVLMPTLLELAIFRFREPLSYSNGPTPILPLADAYECSLSLCAQSYTNLSVANARSVSVLPDRVWSFDTGTSSAINTIGNSSGIGPVQLEFATFQVTAEDFDKGHNSTFTVNQADIVALQHYLNGTLSVYTLSSDDETVRGSVSDASQALLVANIPTMIDNVATSMSNAIRLNSIGTHSSGIFANLSRSATGQVYSSDVFVDVAWIWLILPGLVVLSGALVLLTTIIVTRASTANGHNTTQLWRSSNVALVLHGLEAKKPDEAQIRVSAKRCDVLEKAERMHVKITDVRDGVSKFVQT